MFLPCHYVYPTVTSKNTINAYSYLCNNYCLCSNIHVEEKPKVALKPVKSYSSYTAKQRAPVQAVPPSTTRSHNVNYNNGSQAKHAAPMYSAPRSQPYVERKVPEPIKPVDTRPQQSVNMQYSQPREQNTLLHNPAPLSAPVQQNKPTWGSTAKTMDSKKSPIPDEKFKSHPAHAMFTAPKESTPKDVIDDGEHGLVNESFEESPTHRPRGDKGHGSGGRSYDDDKLKYPPPRGNGDKGRDRGREGGRDGYRDDERRPRDRSRGRDGHDRGRDGGTRDRSRHRDDRSHDYDRHRNKGRDRSKGRDRDHSRGRDRDHSRGRDLDYSRGRDRSRGRYDGSHSRDSSFSRLHRKQSFEDFTTMDYLSGKPLDTSMLRKRGDDSHSTLRNNVSEDDVFHRGGHRRSKSSGRYRNRSHSRDRGQRRAYDDYDINRPHKHDYSSSDNRSRTRHRHDDRGQGGTGRHRDRRNSNDTTATDLVPYSPVATVDNAAGNQSSLNVISPAMTININAQAGSAVHLALGANKGVTSGGELPRLRIEQLPPSSSASGDDSRA